MNKQLFFLEPKTGQYVTKVNSHSDFKVEWLKYDFLNNAVQPANLFRIPVTLAHFLPASEQN